MTGKKTIIYVGGFELPDKNAAAQRVIAVGKIFRRIGYNVVFLGKDKSLDSDSKMEDTKNVFFDFESWATPYPRGNSQWIREITTADKVEQLINHEYKNDVFAVVCYNHPFIAQLKIRGLCRRAGAHFIPDVTEWYDSTGGSLMFRLVKKLDTSLRMRYINFRADGLISTSKYLWQFYRHKVSPMVILPTLFDTKLLADTPASSETKDPRFTYLMYAGSAFHLERINKRRSNIKDRLDKIILMLDEVSKRGGLFVLNIYGLDRDNYLLVYPEHHDILKRLENQIVFHGRKPHKEIIANTKLADFTIFVRDIDRTIEAGFPSKFSESISCGTPVICNRISNIEDYVVEGKNAYFIPLEDLSKQADVIMKIFDSKSSYAEMKQYCQAEQTFDYNAFVVPVDKFLSALG